MNLNTMQDFRHAVYGCFERAADALFNTADALLTETQAQSFPELSLSRCFQRRWSSLYEAFEDGQIDQERLHRVFARYLLPTVEGERLWLFIDATSIERPESQTSPARTVVYKPNLPKSSKPISYGWQFSTVVVLPEQPSSWTPVLAQQRIRSDQTSVEVAAAQLRQLAPELSSRPIVATDRCYSCAPFLLATEGLPFDKLLRLTRKRVLYRPAPAPTGKRGAPRKDGERFQCGNPSTYGQAVGRAPMPPDRPLRSPGGGGCICPRHDTSRSRSSVSCAMVRRIGPVRRARAGFSGREARTFACQRWPWAIGGATRMNMAIVSRSKPCCGQSPGCAPQRNLNALARSSPSCTISWCWLVHTSRQNCVRGRRASVPPVRNKCAGRWPNLWGSWERLPSLPNHAENRLDDQKMRMSDVHHATRWSTSPNQGRKSGANELDGFTFVVIVHPFRTVVLLTAGFG
jgi:hypothetical protein